MEPTHLLTLIGQADPQQTAQLVRDLGFPIAIAVVCLCAILAAMACFFTAFGYMLYRIGNWLAPLVQRLAEGHFETMEIVKESSKQTAQSSQQTAISIQALTETQRAIQREITEQRKLSQKFSDHTIAQNAVPIVAIQTENVNMEGTKPQ